MTSPEHQGACLVARRALLRDEGGHLHGVAALHGTGRAPIIQPTAAMAGAIPAASAISAAAG